MDKVRFGYAMEGTEAYPSASSEGREYATPHEENMHGELIDDEFRVPAEELEGLTSFEKVAQAKKWRNEAKSVLSECQDAVLLAELCGDREQRAKACSSIVQSIAHIVDYNLDYAMDVLYRRCNVYGECAPDFVRIRHGISAEANDEMMGRVNEFIDAMFEVAKEQADGAVA